MKNICKKIYLTILTIVSRRGMKKRKLPKQTIDMWTIKTLCKVWNLKDPERYYEEQISNNIQTIEKKVDNLIVDKIIDDAIETNDWLVTAVDKDPKDLV